VKGDKGTKVFWRKSIYNPHEFSGFRRNDFKVIIERKIKVTVEHKYTKMSYSTVDTNNRPEYDLVKESLEKCVEIIENHLSTFINGESDDKQE
jgi:hypothetical protein